MRESAAAEAMKSWILDNVGFKIVALAVALVLWFGVTTERQTEVRYPVALEIVPESDEETILTRLPETVDVTFAGAGKDLLRLGDQNYRVRKILEPGKIGPRRVILDESGVTGNANLDVKPIAVYPSVLAITTDRIASKRVPLRPLGLEPADGYELEGPVRFEPPSVTLIGPRTLLARIDTVAVDLSRFSGTRSEIREAIPLRLPEYPTVAVQPDSIRILVSLQEEEREAARPRRPSS